MFEVEGKYTTAKVFAGVCNEKTVGQIKNMCNQIWAKDTNIAIMPDTHVGVGCTIGTTMTITDKICPSAVGTDIGCGMLCIKLPFGDKIISHLKDIDDFINTNICSGAKIHDVSIKDEYIESLIMNMYCYKNLKNKSIFMKSFGTLGGGNHFIEISKSNNDNDYYLIIHSGSRTLGNCVASYYVKMADKHCNEDVLKQQLKDYIEELKQKDDKTTIQSEIEKFLKNQPKCLIKKELCYLEGKILEEYLHDMYVCTEYAKRSREYIATQIIKFISKKIYGEKEIKIHIDNNCSVRINRNLVSVHLDAFHTVHNYIDIKHKILRKGAISCQKEEQVIIPINMRDGSLICIGKGNKDYNCSGPHGAGRLLSRKDAKETLTLEEFKKSMEGIYTTSVCQNTLDESPAAYKSIDDIVDMIEDTAEIIDILKPIYNFKSSTSFQEDIKKRIRDNN